MATTVQIKPNKNCQSIERRTVPLQPPHLALLQTTPFYNFLLPFINKEINPKHIIGTRHGVVNLLETYDRNEDAFIIGGKKIELTKADFETIFGIPSGPQEVDTRDFTHGSDSLHNRKFSNFAQIDRSAVKSVLENTAKETSLEAIEDTVKLLIIYIVAFVFFVGSQEVVRLWTFRLCDNLSQLRNYDWGGAIVTLLLDYLQTNPAQKVQGCCALLQFWLCEKTTIWQPIDPAATPHFRRWNITIMRHLLENGGLQEITTEQVKGPPPSPATSSRINNNTQKKRSAAAHSKKHSSKKRRNIPPTPAIETLHLL